MESTLALTFERENLMEEDGNVKLMLDSGRMYYKASYRIASHPPFLAGKKTKTGFGSQEMIGNVIASAGLSIQEAW